MKKYDIIIGAVAIAAAGMLYFSGILRPEGEGAKVVVTVDGDVFGEYSLNEDMQVKIDSEDGFNSFEIKDGRVDMYEADCRDGICVDHSPISLNGETIICLPHKVVVEVVGGEDSGIDSAMK